MKANINTVIVGTRVVLVPYRAEHVPKYHDWMLSEELQTLTASEPLSLEEEYEMQEKWQVDEDKLTFIILSRPTEDTETSISLSDPTISAILPTDERLTKLPMIGDVNIFLYGTPPNLRYSATTAQNTASTADEDDSFYAEVEIMIAEPVFRRKGLALEALQLLLGYATGQPDTFSVGESTSPNHPFIPESPLLIPPGSLVTKITDTNTPSIRLFEKLGFEVVKRIEVFSEVEMRYRRSATIRYC